MKYSLQCYIKTPTAGIRNAVQQLIPSIDDNRVWNGEYSSITIQDPADNITIFICDVRFNVESDRNNLTTSVKGLAGVINACEEGSFVREYRTWHDGIIDGICPRPCEEQTILRKH